MSGEDQVTIDLAAEDGVLQHLTRLYSCSGYGKDLFAASGVGVDPQPVAYIQPGVDVIADGGIAEDTVEIASQRIFVCAERRIVRAGDGEVIGAISFFVSAFCPEGCQVDAARHAPEHTQ